MILSELVPCPSQGCMHVAEIVDRVVMESTDGPIEHARIHCSAYSAHWFLMMTEQLERGDGDAQPAA